VSVKKQGPKKNSEPLTVLILEDQKIYADRLIHELEVAGYDPTWQRVETESDFRQHLDPSLDIIIADCNLPKFTALKAIDIVIEADLDIPVIVVTSTIEETALECIKRGAEDYLLKDRLAQLGSSVEKALKERIVLQDKKNALEALRASEQRYRGITENALVGISIADLDGIITYSNPALEEMLGYSSQELLGMSFNQIIEPEEFTTVRNQINSQKQGFSKQYETIMKCKDGKTLTAIVSDSPLTSKEGEYKGSQAVITNITERAQTEEKFRIIFESAPDPYYLSDLKGKFVDGNEAAERILGYKRDELIGSSFLSLNLLPKNQIPKASSLLLRNVLGKQTGPDEFTSINKDGSEVEVEITTHPVVIDGKPLILGIARDITKRIREKEVQRQSDERYRIVVEHSQNGILIVGEDSKFEYVNDSLCLILGRSRKEIIGHDFTEFLDEESKKLVKDRYLRRQGGEDIPARYEFNILRKDGEPRRVEISSAVVNDPMGKVITIAQIMDITESVQANKKILHLNLVLHKLRKVNQLIIGEKNSSQLIQKVCDILTENRGYHNAWIVLFNEEGKYQISAESGLEKFFTPLNKMLKKGMLPECGTRALRNGGLVIFEEIDKSCEDCPLSTCHAGMSGFSIRLAYGNKIYGMLTVSVPGYVMELEEEKGLFQEIAGNIGFALNNIETEKKEAESQKALIEANNIINRSSMVAFLWKNEKGWPIEYVSENVENIFGYTRQEFLDRKILYSDLIHNDDLKRVAGEVESFSKKIGQQTIVHKPYRIVAKNGNTKWISDATYIRRDTRGIITHYEGIISDITAQVQAENEKTSSQNLLLTLNRAAPLIQQANCADEIYQAIGDPAHEMGFDVTVFTLTNDKKKLSPTYYSLTELAQKVEKITGLSEASYQFPLVPGGFYDKILVGKQAVFSQFEYDYMFEALPKVPRPAIKMIMDLFGTQQSIIAPLIVQGEDFGLLSFSGPELTRLDKPAIINLVNQASRALEKIRIFSETKELATFNKWIVQNMTEGIIIEDTDGVFTFVNPAAERLLGYTNGELVGKHWKIIIPPDQHPLILAQNKKSSQGESTRYEIDLINQEGRRISVLSSSSPLTDEQSHFTGTLVVFTDITERKNGAREIQQHVKRLDALRKIDKTIMGSFNLDVSLNIILEQVLAQLEVDAALVLLYQANLQTLQFAQARGFLTDALQNTNLRLGVGSAGKIGLDREIVFIPDLNQADSKIYQSAQFNKEGFVAYYGVPLTAKGNLVGVLEIFHRSPLGHEDGWVNFLEMLAGQIAIAIDNSTLFTNLQSSNVNLKQAYDATIEGWARALELKDIETEGHSRRVVKLTMDLARMMGISGEKLIHIRRGALLHDIGKMGIPDAILQKPGKLSDEEWQVMHQHPVYTLDWLYPIEYLRPALEIPYSHHERWDGTGYPQGIKGELIPLAARIFAVVDVWDALISDRPYRKAWSKDKALAHIKEESGKHFDPQVVEVFLKQINNQG